MKPEFRVALLGQGFMGKAHSNAYSQVEHFYDCPYRVRRRLLCGRDAASLAAMADRWGWEETTTDWRSAIERSDIDAVDVSLPNYLHAEVSIAAAQAGKMVLCEKPLALSLAEANAMADAARRVRTLVWFNYRRVPAIAYAKQLIDQGRLGTVYHYDAAYRQQWGPDTSRAGTWKMDRAQAGSGVADDLLTHLLDTALYLNGPVQEGIATTRTFMPDRPIDDAFVAMLKFDNGSVGTFEATRFGIGCKNSNSFQMHGSGGMLRFDLERLNHLEFLDATNAIGRAGCAGPAGHRHEAPGVSELLAPGHIIGYEHTFIATLAEFLDAVSRGVDFHPNFADGARSPARARRAAAIGCDTSVDDDRGARGDTRIHSMTTGAANRVGLSSKTRWTIVGLLSASIAINLLDRQVINVLAPMLREANKWRATQFAYIAVAFQIGMMIGQVPAGSFMDRVGTRIGLATIFAAWSIVGGAHALVSSLAGFIFLRFLMGLTAVRQLHRGHQGDRGPVSRRAAGRPPAASSTRARSSDR